MTECGVCCDKYNKSSRRCVQCPYCDYNACSTCYEHFISDLSEEPYCMACRKQWNREVLTERFTKKSVSTKFKEHMEDVLFDREKALLPQTQGIMEGVIQKRKIEAEAKVLRSRLEEMRNDPRYIQYVGHGVVPRDEIKKVAKYMSRYHRYSAKEDMIKRLARNVMPDDDKEKKQFVMPCPAQECRGFLSSRYKCGICEVYVCKDCHEVKSSHNDEEHECNKDAVENAKAIMAETVPCPECHVRIFKIEGCFAKDTPILMYNGSTKMSQDIEVGDVLVGDDGTQRTVQETFSGKDQMYEVKQTNGMSYTVNSSHKLVLKYSGDRTITWSNSDSVWIVKWFDHVEKCVKTKKFKATKENVDAIYSDAVKFRDSLTFSQVIEMTVFDYNELPVSTQKCLMGFKSKDIMWDKQETVIDPYLVGVYLGDGIHNGECISCNDDEILRFLLQWCEDNYAELVHDAPYKFRIRRRNGGLTKKAIQHGASCDTCKGCVEKRCELCNLQEVVYDDEYTGRASHNPFKKIMYQYDLVNNKHVPTEFLVTDRESRLRLLAGIIDTDGCVSNNGKRVEIGQTNIKLGESIVLLARSLGFVVNTYIKERKQVKCPGVEPKDYKDQIHINISGEHLSEIPTLLPRKKCKDSTYNKDYHRTSISVTPVGKGIYFGWQVDGNKRFVLADTTVVRNCDQMFCTMCKTAFSWRTGKKVVGVVHNPHYFDYIRQRDANGDVPRNPLDQQCGGMPNIETLSVLLQPKAREKKVEKVQEIYRNYHHNIDSIIPKYRIDVQNDNQDIRIKYLLNEIDDDKFKRLVQQRHKALEKKTEIFNVIQTLQNVTLDIFQRLDNQLRKPLRTASVANISLKRMTRVPPAHCEVKKAVLTIIKEFDTLREFVNKRLIKVCQVFNMANISVNEKWQMVSTKAGKTTVIGFTRGRQTRYPDPDFIPV